MIYIGNFHRDFQDVDNYYRWFIDALNIYTKHSQLIKRCTTLGEEKLWDEDNLSKFHIFIDQIDRLYFFDLTVKDKRIKCHMIFRICCPGIRVYIELSYDLPSRCGDEEQCHGSGYMLISEKVNLFMNLALSRYHHLERDLMMMRSMSH